MDEGKTGHQQQFLKPVNGCTRTVHSIKLHMEEESLHTRMGMVQGVGSLRLEEAMYAVFATRP
eukprot:8498221-Prorocentrum_lima.AAC.1